MGVGAWGVWRKRQGRGRQMISGRIQGPGFWGQGSGPGGSAGLDEAPIRSWSETAPVQGSGVQGAGIHDLTVALH